MIYFVKAGRIGAIKIGTTIRLSERISQLRADTGLALEILAVMDGDRGREQALHNRFHHLKLKPIPACEWFTPAPELTRFIEDHGRIWDESDDAPAEPLANIVVLRGTEEWKAWLDSLSAANNAPITVTIEQALREMSDRLKHPKPPRRTP